MEKTRLALVSYLNTLPFLEGLEASDSPFDVQKATPAVCADIFAQGGADLALVPVGALPGLKNYRVVSDFCIGCDGAVRTVVVFSHRPLEEVHRIYLDEDSRTSAQLVRIILSKYKKLDVQYCDGIPADTSDDKAAFLMIGDKVFDFEKKFNHSLDLGSAWKEYSGLPFAFAVWICRLDLSSEWENKLNESLKKGLDRRNFKSYPHPAVDLDEYFSKYISYELDEDKKAAIRRFLDLIDPQ